MSEVKKRIFPEVKKRLFSVELTDEDLIKFVNQCYSDGTTPAEVLEGFINDLIYGTRTRGSDERMYAEQYYDRCGYGYWFPDESHSFAQWLLYIDEMDEMKDILDYIESIEGDIQYITEHPEDAEEGEPEDLESQLCECKKSIERFYDEYANRITSPDTFDDGMQSVHDYLLYIQRICDGDQVI